MFLQPFLSFSITFNICISTQLLSRNALEDQEVKEISSQEYARVDPEKRMLANRRSLQEIMVLKWESDNQVCLQTSKCHQYKNNIQFITLN